MTDDDMTRLLRGLVRTEQPGSWPRLLEQLEGNQAALAAARVAYDIGHNDGSSSAWADFHTDNPEAVRLARELMAEVDTVTDEQGRSLHCPRCGGPDREGYPREVLGG